MKFEICLFDFKNDSEIEIKERHFLNENHIHLEIFRREGAWLGIYCDDETSFPINPENSDEKWQSITISNERWWFLAKFSENRFVSELFRTVGDFRVHWSNGFSFTVTLECSSLPNGIIEKIFADFKDKLIRLIKSENNPITRELNINFKNKLSLNEDFTSLLFNYADSLKNIAKRPNTRLFYKINFIKAKNVRNNFSEILQLSKNHARQTIISRRRREDVNTAENQFILLAAYRVIELVQALRSTDNLPDSSSSKISISESSINNSIKKLEELGVTPSRSNFNKVIFQKNIIYSKNYRLYKKLFALHGDAISTHRFLSSLRKTNIEHLSSIYEKWCLIEIIHNLNNYLFTPEKGWVKKIIKSIRKENSNISLIFSNPDLNEKIRLTYQCEFEFENKKIVRPDFVLEILRDSTLAITPKLVLDAKFRTIIGKNGCSKILSELLEDKNYGENSQNMVFILHPCEKVQDEYGLESQSYSGWIKTLPDKKGLKLVLLEWLQRIECTKLPKMKICYNCGHAGHWLRDSYSATSKKLTCNFCGAERIVTHCRKCSYRPLIKNGVFNYFKYFGRGKNNIICPKCGYFFSKT